MSIHFVPATKDDALLIAKLRQQVWQSTYRGIYPDEMLDDFDMEWHAQRNLTYISGENFSSYIIWSENAPAGYLILKNSDPFLLHSLYLLPSCQKSGAGRAAFALVRDICRTQGRTRFICMCQPENLNALGFYAHMGGRIIARDEGHENPCENAVTIEFDV